MKCLMLSLCSPLVRRLNTPRPVYVILIKKISERLFFFPSKEYIEIKMNEIP
jgi:hypothetical protein